MIKLHVSASEKVGTNNYGSIGAQCGLEIELDSRLADEADALHEAITRYQQIATTAMREHLGRLIATASQPKGAPVKPQPQNGKVDDPPRRVEAPSQQPQVQNGKVEDPPHRRTTKPATEPHPDFVEYDEHKESFHDEDDHDDDAPTTGRELLGWARRQSEDAFPWLVKTGKKLRFPDRILDWSAEQVGKAYAAYHNARSNN
jgi:hypothetical protein